MSGHKFFQLINPDLFGVLTRRQIGRIPNHLGIQPSPPAQVSQPQTIQLFCGSSRAKTLEFAAYGSLWLASSWSWFRTADSSTSIINNFEQSSANNCLPLSWLSCSGPDALRPERRDHLRMRVAACLFCPRQRFDHLHNAPSWKLKVARLTLVGFTHFSWPAYYVSWYLSWCLSTLV